MLFWPSFLAYIPRSFPYLGINDKLGILCQGNVDRTPYCLLSLAMFKMKDQSDVLNKKYVKYYFNGLVTMTKLNYTLDLMQTLNLLYF